MGLLHFFIPPLTTLSRGINKNRNKPSVAVHELDEALKTITYAYY